MSRFRVPPVFWRALCLSSVMLVSVLLVAQQPPPPPPPPQAPGAAHAQPLSPAQLDTLVAPVALYPDRLLSQVLVASTYPLEVVEAEQWLQQNQNLQGQQLMDAARRQNWDPSVQALVAFPDVLARLNEDVRWTTDLGNAFLAQQADVMNAVQRMRAQAQASGKLRSDAEQTVTTETQGNQQAIEIQPANPQVVYVPYYDPEYIWGPPDYGYYPAWDYAGFGFGYGPGIWIDGFFGGLGWGYWGWWPNWFGFNIFLNPFFFTHWGFGWHSGWGHGFGHGVIWAHDPGHRMGVPYGTHALNARYGAASAAGLRSNVQAYTPHVSNSFAGRTNTAQTGGWNRFSGTSRSYAPQSGYRASPSYGSGYRNGYSGVPSYHYSAPSYRGSSGYRSSPSYGHSSGSGGGYHSGGGGSRSSGGGFHSSGGGFHSSGGGGFHGGGGSHGGGGHR